MEQEWKRLWTYDCVESVQLATAQALEASGIAVPRGEPSQAKTTTTRGSGCFGVPLESSIQFLQAYQYEETIFQLPRVFVELVKFLEERATSCEGLFRKSGSFSRQKNLKTSFESGDIIIPSDTNPHDVAGLLKLYLRELPNPLLSLHLSPVYEACHALLPSGDQLRCVLLTCLLLPAVHLQCLCALMRLLKLVTQNRDQTLMDANNLAVVMAPNLMKPCNNIFSPVGNPLQIQTNIIQLLIENSHLIGYVPADVCAASEGLQIKLQKLESQSLEDLTDKGEGPGDEERALPGRYRDNKRKKQRTASISEMVMGLGSRLKQKGVALTSGDYHMTTRGLKRKISVKRKGESCEDLVGNSKKPIPLKPAMLTPHPATSSNKYHSMLLRRRHTEHKTEGKPKTARFHHKLFKPSFTARLDFLQQQGSTNTETSLTGLTGLSENVNNSSQTGLTRNSPQEYAAMESTSNIGENVSSNVDAGGMETATLVSMATTNTASTVSASAVTSSFLFATPQRPQLSRPFLDPNIDNRPNKEISLASDSKKPYTNSNAPFTFAEPTPINSRVLLHSNNNKTTPTLPSVSNLDDAFLQTPYPTEGQSPNLLEKISSEIIQRHSRLTHPPDPCTPLLPSYTGVVRTHTPQVCVSSTTANFRVNESYKRAVDLHRSSGEHRKLMSSNSIASTSGVVHDNSVVPGDGDDGSVGPSSPDQKVLSFNSCVADGSLISNTITTVVEDTAVDDDGELSKGGVSEKDREGVECVDQAFPQQQERESAVVGGYSSHQSVREQQRSSVKGLRSDLEVVSRSVVKKAGRPPGHHHAYSATLGMTSDLLSHTRRPGVGTHVMRRRASNRVTITPSEWYNDDDCTDLSLDDKVADTSTAMTSSFYSPSALSASLGITNLPKHVTTPLRQNVSHCDSPSPLLLRIVESNVASNVHSHSTESDSNDKSSPKENNAVVSCHGNSDAPPVTHMPHPATDCHNDIHEGVAPPTNPPNDDDDDNHHIPKIVDVVSDHAPRKQTGLKDWFVSQPPSPKVPLGLRSPWFHSKKNKLQCDDSIRTIEDGKVTKRAQSYLLKRHAYPQRKGHAPLKRVAGNDKENCCHDNTVTKTTIHHVREWIV